MSHHLDDEAGTLAGDKDPASPAFLSFVLTVTAGPDRGLSFAIDAEHPGRALIGHGDFCELRLTDRQASRRHAALERVGRALRIIDLDSTNGTWVDRVKIGSAELQGGEYVRIGATLLHVESRPAAAPVVEPQRHGFGRLVGRSVEMQRLYSLCERLAAARVSIVIEGESGTGKEMLAEALHECGERASGPFVVFDCTSVPRALIESELFGHERGAFTGAVGQRKGVFERANHGTLFIDEIGDLDVALQPMLLRAIERSEIRRVGGDKPLRVDVRIIAATRRNLDREVEAGRFRDDLFHRLAVARLELPPLRNRGGDIAVLARHFWSELGGLPEALSPSMLERWQDYAWPGNVRELRNTVARNLALGDLAEPVESGPHPATGDFIDDIVAQRLPFPQARDRVLEEFEQRYVDEALGRHGGDVAQAAEAAGIGRRYLQKLRARRARESKDG